MTRVVVIGPYPPTADPEGDVVLAEVRAWRCRGAQVDVVSPVPSAAHHCGRTDTVAGAWRVARVVRRADRVVWFAGADAAWPLRRALQTVPVVEVRAGGRTPAGRVGARSVRAFVVRVRAGAPTFVRSLRSRAVRARSGRRS